MVTLQSNSVEALLDGGNYRSIACRLKDWQSVQRTVDAAIGAIEGWCAV